jgi:hypothetical protein
LQDSPVLQGNLAEPIAICFAMSHIKELEILAASPAIWDGSKWQWPSAGTLRSEWFLAPEYETTIDALREKIKFPSAFDKSALAVAYYRVHTASALLKSRGYSMQSPRENLTLLHVAQLLNDDETWLEEISRASFAITHFLGYFESIKAIGGARLRKSVVEILTKLQQADEEKRAQTLKKLLDIGGPKSLHGQGPKVAELLNSKLDIPRLFALQTLPKLHDEDVDWAHLLKVVRELSGERPAIMQEAAKFAAYCERQIA